MINGEGRSGRADVVVKGSRVDAVVWGGLRALPEDARVLDAADQWVIPGLIDMHAHDEVAATQADVYEGKVRQGVTTVLISMDGFSFAPLDNDHRNALIRYWKPVNGDPGLLTGCEYEDYAQALADRLGLNVVLGVPHANLRIREAGFALRPLAPDELARMTARVRDGMEWGCYGLSTGLSYVPAVASDMAELIQLAAAIRAAGGLYVSHLRDYGSNIFAAVEEALELARRLSIAVHLSHLHLSDPRVFGRAEEMRTVLESARDQGLRVTWDAYPYCAGSTALHAFLPPWAQDGGPSALLNRIGDPVHRQRIVHDWGITVREWDRIVISFTSSGRHIGESLLRLAERIGADPPEAAVALLESEQLGVGCVVHQSLEADNDLLAEGSGATVGSDGIPFGQRPHPRYFGAFAASYRRYVRERRSWSPEQAIWRMSTLPARLARLPERGVIEPGAVADLVVLDPTRYCDRATYSAPRLPAEGVTHVLINGYAVLRHGELDAGIRCGEVLRCAPS